LCCSGWGLPSYRVAIGTGELLPHRFTLTLLPKQKGRLLSVALSSPRGLLGLQGILLCGVRTFLAFCPKTNDAIISPTL